MESTDTPKNNKNIGGKVGIVLSVITALVAALNLSIALSIDTSANNAALGAIFLLIYFICIGFIIVPISLISLLSSIKNFKLPLNRVAFGLSVFSIIATVLTVFIPFILV